MAAGDLLAPNLLLAFLAAVAKKYSRNVLKDPVDEAGAAAVAMATAAGKPAVRGAEEAVWAG